MMEEKRHSSNCCNFFDKNENNETPDLHVSRETTPDQKSHIVECFNTFVHYFLLSREFLLNIKYLLLLPISSFSVYFQLGFRLLQMKYMFFFLL